jgi:site-specific recombinase
MQTRTDMNYGRLSEQVTTFNPVASGIIPNIQGLLIQNGYSANQANAATVSALTGFVQKQAYVDAIDYALAVCTVTVLVALAVALFMRSRKKGGHRSAMPLSME